MIDYVGDKIRLKFTGSCLKNFIHHDAIVNIYIVYELGASDSYYSNPTLKHYLFGAVTLAKNADIDKYGCSGYGIGFDRKLSFSFSGGGYGQNVLTFGADISSSAHADNKKKMHISSWERTNTRSRTCANFRKNGSH